jgi:23S rRNA (guanine2445-N2)-methyltransferase / 23S rRNA (guanine2069-N7)-methyltransferase
MEYSFFVTVAKGLESLLRLELDVLAISGLREEKGGVSFTAGLEQGYRVCLWSRIASRVLLKLDTFPCVFPEDLYEGIRKNDWMRHMGADSSFAVSFSGTAPAIRNSHFAALKVKDAIVDQFRERSGRRPLISIEQPDLRVSVHLSGQVAALYLDLSGDGLHKRGYRTRGGKAPLKENLAAAVLIRAGWPEICARMGDFVDPMCGSGTLLIEAAMIAGDIAPGLGRSYFGFVGWKGHDREIWETLCADAISRKRDSAPKIPPIKGYDVDPRAVAIAAANISCAGLQDFIHVECRPVSDLPPPSNIWNRGLMATNPPYGERIDPGQGLAALYSDFGRVLKSRYTGWRAAMLVENAELGYRIGIRSRRPYTLFNGQIECKLLVFEVDPDRFLTPRASDPDPRKKSPESGSPLDRARNHVLTDPRGVEMFVNRLRKNLRNFGRWAEREKISCFRVYDADMPEYALAVDLYRGSSQWVYIQEYQAPRSVDPAAAGARLLDALSAVPDVLGIHWEHVFFKVRNRRQANAQDSRREMAAFYEVEEAGHRFLVNFESSPATGLSLNQRLIRAELQNHARGRRLLNLFGNTGCATVSAAAGGARSTVTVDPSRTALDWAGKNLALNGFSSPAHQFIQDDVLAWIARASHRRRDHEFELIFLDAPHYSNSSGMNTTFDLQRDHAALLQRSSQLLAPGGLLIFATSSRKFKLEKDRLSGLNIIDISRRTLPRDFERNPGVHHCWEIRRDD